MRIVHSLPPNIEEIRKCFGDVVLTPTILFTYGDSVFTTGTGEIPEWILEHERVHSQRQYELGLTYQVGRGFPDHLGNNEIYNLGAESWWNRYINDSEFRLEEELLAHRVELDVFSRFYPDRNTRRAYLKSIAKRLSSGMYGRMISFDKAKKLIKQV